MAGGKLKADPLFQGLTRPAMMLGVSYLYFILNFCFVMVIYINTANFVILLVAFPVTHGIGYLICMKEPRAIELFTLKSSKTPSCKNRVFHGHTNSYDAY